MGLFKPDPPEKIAAKVLPIAEEAWGSGQRYFSPVLVQSGGMHTGGNSVWANREWPIQIEAIESVGWRLHTWQTVTMMPWSGPTGVGSIAAHPLFVRPPSEG